MLPPVGSTSCRMARPTVVLPQPDSPTRASVSPGKIVRSTPSTARTWPVTRCRTPRADREPGAQGRGSRAARRRSSTVMAAPPARRDGSRRLASATRACAPAPRPGSGSNANGQRVWKRQPERPMPRPRHRALDLLEPAAARLGLRDGAQQALGIGVARPAQQLRARALLDDLARVHDGHAVGHLVDHAEVVRDEQHRGAGLGGEVAQQLQDLRADGGVERGGRLIGDQQARAHRHGHGDHDALLEPAGELVRIGARSGSSGRGCRPCRTAR